ncbi:hypothetical protein TNCT_345891 [Trichonephila clavata]|uniref:Uncharacterized protein n=1 Tax=Trichonephila clavata TaxID=2740835 RepID=A0A8X6GF98_TRICU|nr:hypothetical protein TNCT_345891 [Trichonephila clavata]
MDSICSFFVGNSRKNRWNQKKHLRGVIPVVRVSPICSKTEALFEGADDFDCCEVAHLKGLHVPCFEELTNAYIYCKYFITALFRVVSRIQSCFLSQMA